MIKTIFQSSTESAQTTLQGFRSAFKSNRIESTFWEKAVFYVSIAITLFISLFPFYWMVVTSLMSESAIYNLTPTLIPQDITLKHYWSVFSPETFPFVTYFKNSLTIATITSFLSVLVAMFGAYSFSRLEYPGRGLFSRGVLFVYMFSGILLVVPMFKIIAMLGLVDTHLSLIITYLVKTLPVSLYMLGNYFRSVPAEIEEAALMDGYSRLETIFRITLPLSAPAIVAVFIYTFMISWNEYLFASIFLKSQMQYTLPIGLDALSSGFHQVWGQIMAASLMTSIPIIIMFVYLEKYMVEGLTFGAVEG